MIYKWYNKYDKAKWKYYRIYKSDYKNLTKEEQLDVSLLVIWRLLDWVPELYQYIDKNPELAEVLGELVASARAIRDIRYGGYWLDDDGPI